MDRSVYVYGSLLGILLIAAYFSWTHEGTEEREVESAVVWDIKPEQLKAMTYESPDFSATLTTKSDELGVYLWAQTDREKKAPPNPHGQKDEPTPEPKAKRVKTSFKVSGVSGDELVSTFAPLIVRRNLGVVGADRLKEFGFDEPKATLTIVADSERVFEIGGFGYGQRHTYLRDRKSEEVFAVRSRLLKPLKDADSRLPERALSPLTPSDVQKIEVGVGEQKTTLTHKNPADETASFWAIGTAQEPNDLAKSWLENKFFPLQSTEYAADQNVDELELMLTARIFPRDGKPIQIELYRGEKAEFARSSYTRGLVKLAKSEASDAAQDFVQVAEP